VIEVLKHRIEGLHQMNLLKSIKITDKYEPKEEGLDIVYIDRFITLMEIVLFKKMPEKHDKIGY